MSALASELEDRQALTTAAPPNAHIKAQRSALFAIGIVKRHFS